MDTVGGYNGGGDGSKGGGGASDVRQAGDTLDDRIIVAGGGLDCQIQGRWGKYFRASE